MQIEIFQGHNVRTEIVNNRLTFCVKDTCDILGDANPTNVAKRVRESSLHIVEVDTGYGIKPMNFVDERGLIRILQTSRSPLAEPFQDWADERVEQLMQGKTINAAGTIPTTDDAIIEQAFGILQNRLNQTQQALAEKTDYIERTTGHVSYIETFVAGGDLIKFRTLAGQIDVSEHAIRDELLKRGWIYKQTFERWSNKLGKKVKEYQWSAYADKKKYFRPVSNHTAPRLNGEVRHTLKITPAGAVEIAKMFGRLNQLVIPETKELGS